MGIRRNDYPNDGGLRPVPNGHPRVETGAVQFGDDWPGYFLRGDDAMRLALALGIVLNFLHNTEPDADVLAAMSRLGELKDAIEAETIVK